MIQEELLIYLFHSGAVRSGPRVPVSIVSWHNIIAAGVATRKMGRRGAGPLSNGRIVICLALFIVGIAQEWGLQKENFNLISCLHKIISISKQHSQKKFFGIVPWEVGLAVPWFGASPQSWGSCPSCPGRQRPPQRTWRPTTAADHPLSHPSEWWWDADRGCSEKIKCQWAEFDF